MEIVGYIIVGVVGLIIIGAVVSANSFKSRTLRVAMESLQQNISAFPEDSTEYFPTQAVMKATLAENFDLMDTEKTLVRYYSTANPELAAYHILDYVGHLFEKERPNMASWCFAAKDSLEPHTEKARKDAF